LQVNAQPDYSGGAQQLKPPMNGTSQTVLPDTTVVQLAPSPHVIVVRGSSTLCGDLTSLMPRQRP
jgi:hypothetical protein